MVVHEAPVGATVEWYTPPWLFEKLGLGFDLDPASPEAGPVPWIPAVRFISPSEDGLRALWHGRVWLNPPYGGGLGAAFIDRMVDHGNGVLLVAARTETRAFQRAAQRAGAVCFLRERVHHVRPDGSTARSSFASVLMGFGAECERAVRATGLGWTP